MQTISAPYLFRAVSARRRVTGAIMMLLGFITIMLFGAPTLRAAPLTRVPNTTLAMPAKPPTFGFTHQNAFSSLVFTNPIAIVSPPGETNRVFIVQKNGIISVITNLASPTRSTFMDISSKVTFTASNSGGSGEQGLLGMAFHPGYRTNRFFYVFYTGQSTEGGSSLHDILARYQISSSNTNQGVSTSEVKIISQFDRDVNHNAGDIHFGPDGYLYVAVGDEGAEHDGRTNAQQIARNLFAGILRIDVDKKSGNLTPNSSPTSATTTNYLVPNNNPYIGITHFDNYNVSASQVRTEFYAVGLRNPFRFSFDPLTGGLWCGDVGQDQVEEVNYITKGGNYGWAWWEGNNSPPLNMSTSGRPQPSNPIAPIIAYTHGSSSTQGNCVIGGVVYRGQKLAQLYGQYIFADYVSGNFWTIDASHTNGTLSTPSPIFSDSSLHPTAFGTDPANGDVLFTAEKTTGTPNTATIERITYNTSTNGAPIPPTLADTGAFSSLTSLTVNAGIVPYNINVPFWSDNAIKTRWFSVPNTNLDITFNATNNWSFPTGTVWIKHFELQLTNGVASSAKRIETRLLVKNSTGVYGVTYRWGSSTNNATLVGEGGMDEAFTINDGGNIRTQVWHYPSRNECNICHTPEGGFGLGFRTEQLNKDQAFSGGTTNQIQAYSDAGYLTSPVSDTSTLLALATATNASASLEFRSRSFLMANCSQCHQPGGSAVLANWDARITTPITQQGIINGTLSDNLGDTNNHVITPLSIAHSVLLSRVAIRGSGSIQMPPLDSNLVDQEATNLLSNWINNLTNGFWLAATPSAQTVSAGGPSNTFTISSLDVPSFSGSVALSASGAPSGMIVSFSPSSINPPTGSTMTVSADSSTVAGTYTLNLVGTGSGFTYTAPVVVQVTSSTLYEAENLTFTTNGAPATLQTDSGASGGFWIQLLADSTNDFIEFTVPNISAGNYNLDLLYKKHPNRGILSLKVDGALQGSLLDEYTPTPFFTEQDFGNVSFTTNGTHKIRLTVVSRNAASTDYSLSADAFRLTFLGATAPPTNFTLSASPTSRTVTAGGSSTNYTINTTSTNFSSSVTLSVSGLPSGASGGFSPNPITPPASSTLTVSADITTAPGTYSLTIKGIGGGITNTTPATLIVNGPPPPPPTNFTLAVSPGSQSITSDGGDVVYTVDSTATNFSSAVTLSISGLPAGATSGFVLNPITPPQSSTLTITVASNTVTGTYPLTITGTSGSRSTNTTATLIVTSSTTGSSTLYEAELMPVATNGAAANVVADTSASNGEWVSLLSTNSGPWIEFTVTNVTAGIYDLSLLYKQHPNRGIHTLTVDGVQLGGQLNQYSNVIAYPEKHFGTITFTAPGDHAVRLTAVGKDPAAGTPNISADAFRLTSTNEIWLSQDIGAVGLTGSFAQSNNTFIIAGSGADIWNPADQFRYAYQNVSGDVDVIAQVISETQTATFAKAGVMIRASLATNSVNAAVLLTPTNGVALQVRPTTGAASINVTGWITGPVPPYWVRLTRVGNTFTGYSSPDGSAWTQIGQTNVTMSPGVTAGMAVSAHDNTKLNTATFQ